MGNCLSAFRNFCTKSDHEADAHSVRDAMSSSRMPPSLAPSSINPQYTVFISHAGEDKATIAIPLRQKLQEHGITAFVDEADMPPGTDAPPAMTNAMETAKVAVIVISPEFVAKKWPMRELMCFLRRREESIAEGREAPVIIPFFYRLGTNELYDEPRLDRKDKDDNLLYHKSRFYERQERGEPEASIAGIKAALETVRRIMGVRNDVDATNDSSYLMSRRREILLQELCEKVRQAAPSRTMKNTKKRRTGRAENDAFHPHFDVPYEITELVFNFDDKDKNGKASTQEGELLGMLLDRSKGRDEVISVRGIGGVGKTSLLRGVRILKSLRRRFRDGVYSVSLGMHATRGDLIEALSTAVHNSGGRETAHAMRTETYVRKVIDVFRSWFAKKRCLFVIDDVWETKQVSSGILHELLKLHVSGRESKILLSTRSVEIAARADKSFILQPRDPLEHESRSILFRYSRIKPGKDRAEDQRVVNEILELCCGLPLFLAVAGKTVRALSLRGGHEGCLAYHIYSQDLKSNREALLNTEIGSYEGLSARLMISVDLLEKRKKNFGFPLKLSVAEIHRRLSVLKKQERVPMSILQYLWELKSTKQAADIAREFEQVGLADVEFEKTESGPIEVLRYHDSVYEFAVFETRRHGEEKVGHEALLEGYSRGLTIREGSPMWYELDTDGYIHRNLCRHLVEAGRAAELVELLLSPQWIERQLKINGILTVESDFELGISAVPDAMRDASDEERAEMKTVLRLISQAVNLSSPFLALNIAELWYQVHGRLKKYAESYGVIRDYMNRIETEGAKPLIVCKSSFLGEARGGHTQSISVGVSVLCMVLMEDGERVCCGCGDGRIFVVNTKRNRVERQWKAHDDRVISIALGMDESRLVSGSWDHTAEVWEVGTGRCVSVFDDHSGEMNGVAVMGDGRRVISVSTDGTARIWDMETGQSLSKFTIHDGSRIECVALFTDRQDVVVTGGDDKKLRIWNATTGTQVGDAFDGHQSWVSCVAVTPDGRHLVSGSRDNTVRLWDVGSHQQIGDSLKAHTRPVTCIAVSGDGRRLVTGSVDRTIRMWDFESQIEICDPLEGHTSGVTGVAFLAGDDRVLSSSWDGTIRVWDMTQKETKKLTTRHEEAVSSVSFSADGSFVVSGSRDNTLRIWDSTSGEQVAGPLEGHSGRVNDVTVTADGRYILSVSDDETLRVWSFQSHKLLHTLTGHRGRIRCVAVTPKGDRAVTGSSDNTIRVWNMTSMDGTHVVLEEHSTSVRRVFVSDDGLRIVSVDRDDNVFLWDIGTNQVIKRFGYEDSREVWSMSRREILNLVDENTVHDDTALSISFRDDEIVYGEGQDSMVLATLEVDVSSWALSPDKETICLGLDDGQVAFMKLIR